MHPTAQGWLAWAGWVLAVALSCVASAGAVRAIGRSTPPGLLRLALCLPAAALYCVSPFAFKLQSASRASAAAMLMWLATFKLLAFALGRGYLAKAGLTLGQFTALLLWPIVPVTGTDGRVQMVDRGQRAAVALRRVVWRLPENLAVTVVGLYTLTHPAVPLFVKTYSAAFGVCAYCGLWANACAALVTVVHGLEVGPAWERPWLQTSLGDFWGRRWNLPASSSLKHLVYEPLVEGSLVPRRRPHLAAPAAAEPAGPTTDLPGALPTVLPASSSLSPPPPPSADGPATSPPATTPGTSSPAPTQQPDSLQTPSGRNGRSNNGGGGPRVSKAARLAGLAATFLVSGAMHEVLLVSCTGDWAQLGKQTLFFAIQAPLMIAEQQLVKTLQAARVPLPTWLCIPVASLSLQIPARYLFWGAYFAAVSPRSTPLSAPGAGPSGLEEALLGGSGAAAAAAGLGLAGGAKTEL